MKIINKCKACGREIDLYNSFCDVDCLNNFLIASINIRLDIQQQLINSYLAELSLKGKILEKENGQIEIRKRNY